MGGKDGGANDDTQFRPQRDDEWDWEYERSKFIADWEPQFLADMVARSTIRQTSSKHAYTTDDIVRLRNFLKADVSVWPDDRLHRHTDEFAVLVGLRIRTERQLPPGDRIKDIRNRLVEPAQDLLSSLSDDDFSKEFTAPWGDLRNFDHVALTSALQLLGKAADKHIEIIRATSAKGKGWDSDLKDYFIHMAAILCEFIDRTFLPTAKGSFNKLAYLLAGNLFFLMQRRGE